MIDYGKIRANLRQRAEAQARHNLSLWKQADKEARLLIEAIYTQYSVRRIWQWGSLLHPERFGPQSDIDLAIEGIPDPETFFAILGLALDSCSFSPDIVDLDNIAPEFASIIRAKGKIVYERSILQHSHPPR